MKRGKIAKKLRESFPYPKLTIWADQRFDEILNGLPGKEASSGPRHAEWKNVSAAQEEKELPLVSLEEPPRHRWAGRAAQCGMAFVLLAALCLSGLDMIAPSAAENLPGLGGLFRNVNGLFRQGEGLPVAVSPSPQPEEACSLTVTGSQRMGHYLFLDLRLEVRDEFLRRAAWLSTAWQDAQGTGETMTVTVNGRKASLVNETIFTGEDGVFAGRTAAWMDDETLESAAEDDALEVTVRFGSLQGMYPESRFTTAEKPDCRLEGDVSVSEKLWPENSLALEAGSGFFCENGVAIEHMESGLGQFLLSISCPCISGMVPAVTLKTQYGWELVGNGIVDEWEEGGRMNYVYSFEGLPEGTESLSVLVYSQQEGEPRCFVDGNMLESLLLASFTVDVKTMSVLMEGNDGEADQKPVPIEDFAAIWETGPRFCWQHVFAAGSSYSSYSARGGRGDWAKKEFVFCSDVDNDLPLEAEIYLDGDLRKTIHVYRTADCVDTVDNEAEYSAVDEAKRENKINGYHTENEYNPAGEDYDVEMCVTDIAPQEKETDMLWIDPFVRRMYRVTVYFPVDEEEKMDFWDAHKVEMILRNHHTGEIVRSFESGSFPAWSSLEEWGDF